MVYCYINAGTGVQLLKDTVAYKNGHQGLKTPAHMLKVTDQA